VLFFFFFFVCPDDSCRVPFNIEAISKELLEVILFGGTKKKDKRELNFFPDNE
jgi:hypothetical protein